ncbi:D-arabinitol dehydrogenase 1 [Neonectria ditissima]|uniref:D-arabinitol dehydrogenase 1 n=1 Tax=Neonectria ditissima TaxID=78410 RepID=A0A0P7AUZ6_9HYPO|nr:D-arabinitol dehydrogenase 1 [Neonectria ditissima]
MVSLPTEMKALRYEKPEDFAIVTVPLPEMRDNDVLVKVKACGVCGTDLHIHEGEFIAKFPLIPGHETVGESVKGFAIGDRVAADNSELCNECFYCRRGQPLLCENFNAHGVTMNGGFAEYCAYPAAKVFKIHNLSWVDATLLEPASCACHGLEKIRPKLGSHVLMFGAGPTGLMLAQLLRQNGGCKVTIAAPGGLKLDLAKSLDAADTYIELSRSDPAKQFAQMRTENPYGFDIVVEATGSVRILEDSINYVRRGGTLVVYGVYAGADRVSWPPSKIFGDEITILGSFSETYMFPATIDYLDTGKVKTAGIVNKTFRLEQFGEALQSIKDKTAIKAAIVFDDVVPAAEEETNGVPVPRETTNGVSIPEEKVAETPAATEEEKFEDALAPAEKTEETVEETAPESKVEGKVAVAPTTEETD